MVPSAITFIFLIPGHPRLFLGSRRGALFLIRYNKLGPLSLSRSSSPFSYEPGPDILARFSLRGSLLRPPQLTGGRFRFGLSRKCLGFCMGQSSYCLDHVISGQFNRWRQISGGVALRCSANHGIKMVEGESVQKQVISGFAINSLTSSLVPGDDPNKSIRSIDHMYADKECDEFCQTRTIHHYRAIRMLYRSPPLLFF